MSVKSNSGAADARAAVTGPSAEVAARLNPLPDCSFVFQSFSTLESSNCASWHRVLQATDRRTGRQTTCNLNTALCTRARILQARMNEHKTVKNQYTIK